MIQKGLRFGMMLQLAIGPMCLFVLKTSSTNGIAAGLVLVAAIALVDAVYITLAGCGAATIFRKKNIQQLVKVLGCIILAAFGIDTMLSAFHHALLPHITLFSDAGRQGIFWQGILLTASNPLTILFWGGVFSTQIIDNQLTPKQLFYFGIGCVLSTILFLSSVSVVGSVLNLFLPKIVIQILNVLVGGVLIFFGIRLLRKH